MELNELKTIWKAYDTKLEKSLKLNLRCLEMIQAQKIKSKLTPLLWLRVFEAIVHIAAIMWTGNFLFAHFFEVQFSVSAAVLMLFFIIAFSNCLIQIIIIKQIDYSENIISIQRKLNMLQSYIINYIRLTFLVIPTWLAYPVILFKAVANFDIISQFYRPWWQWNIAFTIIIIPICVWLYRQISYKNIHKKWVKFIIEKSAGSSVTKALEFIKELDELKEAAV